MGVSTSTTLTLSVALCVAYWSSCAYATANGGNHHHGDRGSDSPSPGAWCDGVFSEKGIVSSLHKDATAAGLDVLERGGNAVDAALAVQWALSVTTPQSCGIGGGSLIMYYDAETKKVYSIDGREEAPAAFHENIYCNTTGQEGSCIEPCECESGAAWEFDERATGGNSVGVPGTVAAFGRLHDHFGKIDFSETFPYAVDVAYDGFEVYQHFYDAVVGSESRLARFPASADLYLPGGSVPALGTIFRNPDHGATLEHLAANGWRSFYEGVLADDLVDAAQGAVNEVTGLSGLMTAEDLANYRAVFREPIGAPFGDLVINAFPPPTAGGMLTAQTAGLLSRAFDANASTFADGPLSANYLHQFLDAQDIAWSDRSFWMGDADFVDVPLECLTAPEYITSRFNELMAGDNLALSAGVPVEHGVPPGAELPTGQMQDPSLHERGTSHFVVADKWGNVVSTTTTVERGFGAAVVVPGRGFILNNELTDFSGTPSDAETGLLFANRPQGGKVARRTALGPDRFTTGGKRPLSSMNPLLVTDQASGKPVFALGSPGGSRIPGQNFNVLYNVLFFGTGLQTAVDTPRALTRNNYVEVDIALAEDAALIDDLASRGFTIQNRTTFGPVEAVQLRYESSSAGSRNNVRGGQQRGRGRGNLLNTPGGFGGGFNGPPSFGGGINGQPGVGGGFNGQPGVGGGFNGPPGFDGGFSGQPGFGGGQAEETLELCGAADITRRPVALADGL